MSEQDLFYQRIGLAYRAGRIVTGDEGVMKAIRSKTAKLVIVASDASDNTKKKFMDKGAYYDVPVSISGNREQLGTFLGKQQRVVIAVTDTGFAKLIGKSL